MLFQARSMELMWSKEAQSNGKEEGSKTERGETGSWRDRQHCIAVVIRSSSSKGGYILGTGATFHNVMFYHPIFRLTGRTDRQ